MICCLLPIKNIYAFETDEVIESELEVVIIAGDGSFDNPYHVDYNEAPHFKEYLDSINENIIDSLDTINSNEGIMPLGIYENYLTGTPVGEKNFGGEWTFTGNAPSVAYNGNVCLLRIEYITRTDTAYMNQMIQDGVYGSIKGQLVDILKKPMDDALDDLIKAKITAENARVILKVFGKLNNLYSYLQLAKLVNDCFVAAKYSNAASNGYGMINAAFRTAYQGSWYEHCGEDTWTDDNYVKLPNSAYGTGTFYSHSM